MLILCYPVLVSLALAAPGLSRTCYDYCRTKISDPIKDASVECDCANFIDTVNDSDESSMIILDDTGVYFVPAAAHSFQGEFSSRPFFISNPAKLIPKTKNRINREFVTLKEQMNDPVPSSSAHVEIYERTETISHTSINEDLRTSPLYLDIEIQEPTDKDRATVQPRTFIQDYESTERALVECLDFQVVHYTRKFGYIEKFREFWTARNLDKYENWSDLDIEENIREWCSKPESVVQQSFREIKEGIPKKMLDSKPHNNENNNQFKSPENSTTLLTFNNATEPPVTYNNKSTKTNQPQPQNITEVYDTPYDPTEDWPFIDVTLPPILKERNINEIQNSNVSVGVVSDTTVMPFIDVTWPPILKERNINETQNSNVSVGAVSDTTVMPFFDVTLPPILKERNINETQNSNVSVGAVSDTTVMPFFDVTLPPILKERNINKTQNSNVSVGVVSDTTVATEITLIKYNPDESIIVENQPIGSTAIDSENDLDTMASEDISYPYVPTVTEVKKLDDAYQLDNNTTILQTPTTPVSIEESLERHSAVANINILDGRKMDEHNTLSYDKSQISVTETNPELREKYEEKDIRIPKIITKECQNHTIQTTLDGFEELPNNDFNDSTSRSEMFENRNGENELDITGRLYLVSKNQLVPMRFVQTKTGAISFGVDGPALCDQVVLKTVKKSHLLTVLCEYVQSKMYTNKNSSVIPN